MSLRLACPKCAKKLVVGKPRPGQRLHCPFCTTSLRRGMVVSTAVRAPLPKTDPIIDLGPPAPAAAPDPAPSGNVPKWATDRRALVALGAGGALVVLALSVTAFTFLRPPANPAPVAPAPIAAVPAPLPPAAVSAPASPPALVEEPARTAKPEIVVRAAAAVLESPPAPVVTPLAAEVRTPKGPPERIVIKPRQPRLTDEDLRRQLIRVPEVALNRPGEKPISTMTPAVLAVRPDLAALPFRMGDECQLGKEAAENLHVMSRTMRRIFTELQSTSTTRGAAADPRTSADDLRAALDQPGKGPDEFRQAAGVGCLMQMLQPENSPVRKLLVERLAQVPDACATEALARLALYDLNADVRADAVQALASRPMEDARRTLVEGFRYPWAPVADHAAEALVALKDREALPALERLDPLPSPNAPSADPSRGWVVRELVRVNHLTNCQMCHAPSKTTADLVRGRVPSPREPLPPTLSTQYYESNDGIFVRADATYLRQDFSVPQPVENHGPWPIMQRYDYVVRARPATREELTAWTGRKDPGSPQADALRYAIRELQRP